MPRAEVRYDLSRLPTPDEHGNYWLGDDKRDNDAPAIFPIKSIEKYDGQFYLYRGKEGVLFEGGTFRAFTSAMDALRYLRRYPPK